VAEQTFLRMVPVVEKVEPLYLPAIPGAVVAEVCQRAFEEQNRGHHLNFPPLLRVDEVESEGEGLEY